MPATIGAAGERRKSEAPAPAEVGRARAAARGAVAALFRAGTHRVPGQRMRAVGVGPGGGCVGKPIVARACRTVSLLGVPRAVRRQLTLLGAKSPAGTRLLIVDLAGLEDEAAGRLDRMERRATATQLAMHREQRKIPDFALRARQGLGEQDPGAQRPATAARLA